MREYKAMLFNPDGDYVTDFTHKSTKEEVEEALNDMGSKWVFYPISFIVTDKVIVEAPTTLQWLKGRKISTAIKWIKENTNNLIEDINNDFI